MISVYKDFYNPPKDLQGKQPKITPAVKKQLNELYHYKCAFCEIKSDSQEGHEIVRYRPEKIYPWLKFEWSNLLPVCPYCSFTKGEDFPVSGNRVKEQPINKEENLANSGSMLSEQPIILHPEIDTPENYFHFNKTGTMVGHRQRGSVTLEILEIEGNSTNDLHLARYESFELFIIKSFIEFYYPKNNNSIHRIYYPTEQYGKLEKEKFFKIFLSKTNAHIIQYFGEIFNDLFNKAKSDGEFSFYIKSRLYEFQEKLRAKNILPQIVELFAGDYSEKEYINNYKPYISQWIEYTKELKKNFSVPNWRIIVFLRILTT